MSGTMKINVLDIPAEGLEITADSEEDAWFRHALSEALPELQAKGHTELLLRQGVDNISVAGELELEMILRCDRCLEAISEHLFVPLQQVFFPEEAYHGQDDKPQAEIELTAEDLECSFYRNRMIDLGEFLGEQMVLALPVKFLCSESCCGLCSHCGTNLNQASCSCQTTQKTSPFAVLKSL